MSLTSFARNPRKALRRLSAEGLILTRPGEPPLRVMLAGSEMASDLPAADDVDVTETMEDTTLVAPVESVVDADVAEELGVLEIEGRRDEFGDIARAALTLLPREQFLALVSARTPWLDDVPPAVLRMVLDDVETARLDSGASLEAIDDVLRGWRMRSAAFLR